MKILVCVSKTPETTAKIAFSGNNTTFITDNVNFIMNPYDEWYALVRGIELVAEKGGSVTLLNVGPSSNDPIIRKGLAIGANDAIRVNAEPQSAIFVAKQIAAVAKDGGYDVLFFGKETIDYNGSEVPGMVSELLDIPFIAYGTHLEMNDGSAKVTREIEGGVEVVEVPTPFAVSCAKGMAEQKIPNMRGIMMAKRKPLKVVEPVAVEENVSIVSYALPVEKTECRYVDPENMDELVKLLKTEAKVL